MAEAEDSHPWKTAGSNPDPNSHQENDKELSSGKWVDKSIVNKHEASIADHDWVAHEDEAAAMPDFFHQKYASDSSTVFQAQQHSRSGNQRKDFELHRNRFDPAVTTDDSDDLDVATSDSSEADALWWQVNAPKAAVYTNNNNDESKIRKPSMIKPANSSNPR